MMYPKLAASIQAMLTETDRIDAERRARLSRLADYVRDRRGEGTVRLNFICTHNSRRSHLAMVWAAVAAEWFGISGVETYSGGTEATAFNPRAVAALERIGFRVDDPGGDNPHYGVHYAEDRPALLCYSKTYDDPANPTGDFAAVMTCSEADANCPFIPGASLRLPLTYEDPKAADGSPAEAETYDARTRQIGREILYAFSLLGEEG
ncbi:arsenate reductase [Lewinella marina]|nr:protein-tyrosine-phosphatase [Neolewinella marina]NJB87204.1 arsenate reductase [Neolewinella marina]